MAGMKTDCITSNVVLAVCLARDVSQGRGICINRSTYNAWENVKITYLAPNRSYQENTASGSEQLAQQVSWK